MNMVIYFGLIVRWLFGLVIGVHFSFFWGLIEERVVVVVSLMLLRIILHEGRRWVVGIHGCWWVIHLHVHHRLLHIMLHIVGKVLFASLV